ncbi:60S ribosomal protein L5 (Fragment), partial [Linum perenne]
KILTISPTHIGRPFTSVDGAASKTNKDDVAQIIHSTIVSDHVVAAAYSHALPHLVLRLDSLTMQQATREDYSVEPTPKKSDKPVSNEHKRYFRHISKRLTSEERRAKLMERLNALNSAMMMTLLMSRDSVVVETWGVLSNDV